MTANAVFRSTSVRIVVSGFASVVWSVGAAWLMSRIQKTDSVAVMLAIIGVFLLSFALPLTTIAQALYHSFRAAQPPRIQARLILLSYFTLLAVFAGVYFSLQFMGDYDHAMNEYLYYRAAGEDLQRGRIEHVNQYPREMQAFVGMSDHLWTTVDDLISLDEYSGLSDVDRYRAELASNHGFYDVVVFNPKAIPSVLSDCLHLSTITLTSVGYGNISPRMWVAKLVTNIEALSGVILLVVALGMLLSGFNDSAVAPKEGDRKDKLPHS